MNLYKSKHVTISANKPESKPKNNVSLGIYTSTTDETGQTIKRNYSWWLIVPVAVGLLWWWLR